MATRVITEQQWQNLHKKIGNIQSQLLFLERRLPEKQKRYLKFEECVPPKTVCKDVASMLEGINQYTGFIGRLAEYYGCETMQAYIDTSIDPKYSAIYRSHEKAAYTRTPTVPCETILHEFFHHLVALNVVVIPKGKEEHYADKYAEIFQQRVNSA